jgi:hypothetical protein
VGSDLRDLFYLKTYFCCWTHFMLGHSIMLLYCGLLQYYYPWSSVFFHLSLPLCHEPWRHSNICVVIQYNYVLQMWLRVLFTVTTFTLRSSEVLLREKVRTAFTHKFCKINSFLSANHNRNVPLYGANNFTYLLICYVFSFLWYFWNTCKIYWKSRNSSTHMLPREPTFYSGFRVSFFRASFVS